MTAAHHPSRWNQSAGHQSLERSQSCGAIDRGPFVGHRVIDLGHGAAKELGLMTSGVAQVKLEVLR